MAGLYDLFVDGEFNLQNSRHSRLDFAGVASPFKDMTAFNVIGAPQEVHELITGGIGLPYYGTQVGPINDITGQQSGGSLGGLG